MRTASAILSLVCALLGTACLLSFHEILDRQTRYFLISEPYYSTPVASPDWVLHIRQDSYGKGYFGASRNGGRTHQGIDILAPLKDPIYASKSGRVTFSGETKGYGQYVEILHPDGLVTRYAHLSARSAVVGAWIPKGRKIGECGKTGNASSPRIKAHLHFEIRDTQKPLNPSNQLLDPKLVLKLK